MRVDEVNKGVKYPLSIKSLKELKKFDSIIQSRVLSLCDMVQISLGVEVSKPNYNKKIVKGD